MLNERELDDFIGNSIERIKRQKEQVAKKAEFNKKEYEELKKACINVFSTRDGVTIARALMRMSGIYSLKHNNNNIFEMGKERGREEIYLLLVKGMLNESLMMEIEKKIEIKEETR